MPPKCTDLCEDHKKVFLSVCGFYCAILIVLVGYIVSNDSRARASEITIATDLSTAKLVANQEHAEMMEKVLDRINNSNQAVVQRLSRIEAMIK
jgi:hypothetical protein